MGFFQLTAVSIVLLLGLVGVLIPGVPGLLLCWAGVLWWTLSTGVVRPDWYLLVGATALLLLSQVLRLVLPGERVRHREPRVAWRVLGAGGIGAALGFTLLPVLGAVPGYYVGVYLTELARLRDGGNAQEATRATVRAVGSATLVEYLAAMLVISAWIVTVLLR